jgi:acyl-homoserine lactone acylase PvdQ
VSIRTSLAAAFAVVLVSVLPATAMADAPASPTDYANIAMDILPAGNYGSLPTPSTLAQIEQQADMYNALTATFNTVTEGELPDFFKPMGLGNDFAGPSTVESVPEPGVTIIRDSYNVPHVFGVTRDDVTWGAGWVEAEDQGLLLSEARYLSYLAAIDAPGLNAVSLIGNLGSFTPSKQAASVVSQQTKALDAAGTEGQAVLHDIDVYLEGINAYLFSHGYTGAPFTRTDIYAFNALKDQFVGEGGGQQAANGEFLASLEQRLGAKKGFKVWNDLREANDPEAPVSVPGTARFQAPPKSMSGNVMLAPNSLSAGGQHAMDVEIADKHWASNALLVSGARSSTGHPIMVAGPQIGYYYPGFTTEVALQGPGIDQRGITSAPFPGYIFIGRSQDQAWSLTSAGLDQITTYVETLCDHSTHKYIYDGKCRAMQLFDAGQLSPTR